LFVLIDIAKIQRLGQDSKYFLQNFFDLLRQGWLFATKREKCLIFGLIVVKGLLGHSSHHTQVPVPVTKAE